MPLNKDIQRDSIPFLVPDLPQTAELLPYLKVIDENRWYSNFGPLVHEFEQKISTRFFDELNPQDERVVACSNGTTAIELALRSLRLRKKARVLVPSFTFPASVAAIINAGYAPVFSDVDPISWQLTPQLATSILEKAKIDAVLPVAALGLPVNAREWSAFYRRTQIPVVVDAAASLGEQTIAAGISFCFSLHATKALGVGEGGLVLLPSQEQAEFARRLSNFGFCEGHIEQSGSNYKLSELHAAVGLAQLERYELIHSRREHVRLRYQKNLAALMPFCDAQFENDSPMGKSPVVRLQPLRFRAAVALKMNDRFNVSVLSRFLNESGIGNRRWYHPVAHVHQAYRRFDRVYSPGQNRLIVTEQLNTQLIGLPFHGFLSDSDVEYVIERVLFNLNRQVSPKANTLL